MSAETTRETRAGFAAVIGAPTRAAAAAAGGRPAAWNDSVPIWSASNWRDTRFI